MLLGMQLSRLSAVLLEVVVDSLNEHDTGIRDLVGLEHVQPTPLHLCARRDQIKRLLTGLQEPLGFGKQLVHGAA
jgi:hypothetical protein